MADETIKTLQRPLPSGPFFMVVIGVACGVAGAFGAIVFRLLIRLTQGAFFAGSEGVEGVIAEGIFVEAGDPLEMARNLPVYWRIALPALGGLIVGPLVYFFAREAKGHGVPEVMEAVALRGGVIRPRVAAVKTLASAITIGSGGSVGREGPIVQIGAALGSSIAQLLRAPARERRAIASCGAAAGVAATFNAPIAGAFFAAEVIIGNFAVTHFAPIVIASVVATVLSRSLLGDHPIFDFAQYEMVSPLELIPYIVLGVICGLVAHTFVRLLYGCEDLFEKTPLPPWLRPALGGLLVGMIGAALPQIYGVGYSSITSALAEELPLFMLAGLLVAKLFATSITVGSGGSGGIFAPSLFLGAMAGGLFGSVAHQLFPNLTAGSGAYALVGMGAVVAAGTHAPLTAIIILFELTQNITIVPPLMAACVVSTLVARLLSHESIYTIKLSRRGVKLEEEQDPNLLKNLKVGELIDREPEIIGPEISMKEVLNRVINSDHTEFFVQNEAGEWLGAIDLRALRRVLDDTGELSPIVVASDMVESDRPSLLEEDSLDIAMQLFSQTLAEEIAVVESLKSRKLLGSIHKKDVIKAYHQETLRRDLAGTFSSTLRAGRIRQFDLGDGFQLEEIVAPTGFTGKSLRELHIREQTGTQIILVRRNLPDNTRGSIIVPGPDYRFQAGDQLVAVGRSQDLRLLETLA